MPETVAVPTVVPPLVQVVGALAWGPKTVTVIVPDPPLDPLRVAVSEPAAIAVPVGSVLGAAMVNPGEALATTVEVIPLPHVLTELLLLASPL